jgi:DNA-binding NtrC family response regulator
VRNKAHLLVVARDLHWRVFAAQTLLNDGYSVHTCSDTQSALQQVSVDGFDLIIVDAPMTDLLNALATHPDRHRLLVVTVAQSVPEAVLAYRRGALDYVSKAFNVPSWQATISAVLQKRPAEQLLPV